MLIGNPDRFAFLIERVPAWEVNGFVNGLFCVFINGRICPDALRTTDLRSDLHNLLEEDSPLTAPTSDQKLYALQGSALFHQLCERAFFGEAENSEEFLLPFWELSDAGYCFFLVSSGQKVRILAGRWQGADEIVLLDEVETTLQECARLREELQAFYDKISGG